MICNLSRKVLSQSGDGHFCPVGGFNVGEDKTLLLDTARFKYPPHWVGAEQLYQSVCTADSETGELRGFILLTRKVCHVIRVSQPPSEIRQPSLPTIEFESAFESFIEDAVPVGRQGEQVGKSLNTLLDFLFANIDVRITLFVYLFQVNDWFSSSDYCPCERVAEYKGFLSCNNVYRNKV